MKYVVHRFTDNEMGLKAINGSPVNFDLGSYYEGSGWTKSKNTSTTVGPLTITGYSPELSGASDGAYSYTVSIGLPPSNI